MRLTGPNTSTVCMHPVISNGETIFSFEDSIFFSQFKNEFANIDITLKCYRNNKCNRH